MKMTDTIFGLSHEVLDDDLPLVVTGMAGAAKSTNTFSYYSLRGSVVICTSTVRLMKGFEEKFGCPCTTIAGGTHVTKDGVFFAEEKDIDADYVILDEVLQTNSKIFDWVLSHRDKHKKIILMTDDRQMLPKVGGETILKKFKDFCKRPDVHTVNLNYSYRPINDETRRLYNELYDLVENPNINAFEKYRHIFPTISYSDMPFSIHDVYLTHTNDTEVYMYKDKNIYHREDVKEFLIPKGHIARKTFDLYKYAILPQKAAEKRHIQDYLQYSRIGTVTRYQGSEVEPGQKCYFMVDSKSRVTNREFYTAFTRCKDWKSFVIVICDEIKKDRKKVLGDYKIKDMGIYHCEKRPDCLADITEITVKKYIDDINRKSRDFHYSTERIFVEGEEYDFRLVPEKKPRFSMDRLVKKDTDFDYDFMDDIYEVLAEHGILEFRCPHFINDKKNSFYPIDFVQAYPDCDMIKPKDVYSYYLDFMSAYPHVLESGKMPTTEALSFEYDDKLLNFFYISCPFFPEAICTEQLVVALKKAGWITDNDEVEYLFSTTYKIGTPMAEPIMKEVYKNQDTKKGVAGLHWGFLEKNYMTFIQPYDEKRQEWLTPYYVRQDYFNREILMAAILSELFSMMIDIIRLYGDSAWICVDAVHFDDIDKMMQIIPEIEKAYAGRPFRIKKKQEAVEIYKNYEIPTADEDRKRREREKKRRQRAKKKEQEC